MAAKPKQKAKPASKSLAVAKRAVAAPALRVHDDAPGSEQTMHVEMMPIFSVRAYGKNPRIIPDSAVAKVASSLKEFGWRQPLVVDEQMTVIVGHTRLMAAAHLGMTHVPVHVARGLSKAQVKAYRLADNRVAQESSWEMQILGEEMIDLRLDDFDLSLTGFDGPEIDDFFPDEVGEGGEDDADLTPPAVPTTKRGDIYQLGRHRLVCGDCTDAVAWDTLMQCKQADLVWTDPPYGVNNSGGTKDARSSDFMSGDTLENDDLDAGALEVFLRSTLALAWGNCKPGGVWYVTGLANAGPGLAFARVLMELGIWRHTLAWVKDSLVFGRADYHYRHEPIYYGWKEGAAHLAVSDRTQDTVWEIPRPKRSDEHPTMKPVELVTRAIENSSKPGQIVVDPFGGSGTTMIAAEQTGRTAYLMEIDPRYCDVIIRRWEKVSGEAAVRL